MSETPSASQAPESLTRDEVMSALFANFVLQQANLAMMFMGKVPHPETGKAVIDLEAAQMFIDNLEMIEVKTKGNLNPDEAGLLKQSLMSTRMTFVQVADAAPAQPSPAPSAAPGSSPVPPPPAPAPGDADADERRKYVKKY
jgi:hypothetical protein